MAARRKVRALPVSMAAFGCMLCAIMARAAAATDACDASSPPSPSSPLASLDRDALDIAAYEAVERDDLPAAVDAFGEMVRLDPADAFAHMWRGHLQVRNGQLRGAAASFERAVSTVGERMLAEDAVEGYAASSKRAQLELSLRRVHERLGDAPPSSDGALASEKRKGEDQDQDDRSAKDHRSALGSSAVAGGAAARGDVVRVEAVQRIHWSHLTHASFDEFAQARKPIVIEGHLPTSLTCPPPPNPSPTSSPPPPPPPPTLPSLEGLDSLALKGGVDAADRGVSLRPWEVGHLRHTCGHLRVPLKRHAHGSPAWASLVEQDAAERGSLADFLDEIELDARQKGGHQSDHEGVNEGGVNEAGVDEGVDEGVEGGVERSKRVLFDWPLRDSEGCTALLNQLRVPSYFTRLILSAYGPSLFVQRDESQCGLHVDAGQTHFWQYVWGGRKRWRIFDPKDWARLFGDEGWQRAFFRDARCSGFFSAEVRGETLLLCRPPRTTPPTPFTPLAFNSRPLPPGPLAPGPISPQLH